MSTPPAPAPVEETLAWEAEKRPLVGLSAIAAGALSLLGFILSIVNAKQVPDFTDRQVNLLDVLRRSAQGQTPGVQGRLAAQLDYIGGHSTLPIISAVLSTLGLLLLFPTLAYLFRAVVARRPQFPRWALIVIAVGVVLFGVTYGILNVGTYVDAQDFAGKPAAEQTNLLAGQVVRHDGAYAHGAYGVAGTFGVAGSLASGLAFVLVAIAAMRVGLLTRFMGILGAIVGATFVLPLDQPGVIRSFWVIAIGFLILGKWPNGVPPAWASGREEPWPSQQALREARERQQAEARGEEPSSVKAKDPRAEVTSPVAARKKKRKRR